MDSSTEATGSETSVLPPAIPSGRRAGTGAAPVEPFLPPPAGRAAFRQRFTDVGAEAVEDGSRRGTTVAGVAEAPGAGAATAAPDEPLSGGAVQTPGETISISEEVARPYPAEGEAEGRIPRVADPDLAHLTRLLSDLVEDLQETGEAALDIRDGLPSFQVTLRAYCRGYLDGRRGAREE